MQWHRLFTHEERSQAAMHLARSIRAKYDPAIDYHAPEPEELPARGYQPCPGTYLADGTRATA